MIRVGRAKALMAASLGAAAIAAFAFAACSSDGGGSDDASDAGSPDAGVGAIDGEANGGGDATGGGDGASGGGDASADAAPREAGVCTPVWDGSLALPATGTHSVTGWELVSASAPSGTVHGLAGTSASDIWYSGQSGYDGYPRGTTNFVAHYDGVKVRALMGLPQTTWPIATVSPTEAWLGPDLRYKDGVLAKSPASAPGKTAMKFFATNDGWSVGQGGVWRWDGATWTSHGTMGAISPFTTIDGDAPDDVWVAAGTVVRRWNGTAWQPPPVPLPSGYAVTKLRVLGPTDVWSIGNATGALHFDGVSWNTISYPYTSTTLDFDTNGTKTFLLINERIGFVQGTSIVATDSGSYPCFPQGKCEKTWVDPAGQVYFVGNASGIGRSPWIGAGLPGATSLVKDLRAPTPAGSYLQLPGGDVLALADGGKLYRGTFGNWTQITPPKVSNTDAVTGLASDGGNIVWVISSTAGPAYWSIYDGTSFGPIVPLPCRSVHSTSKTNGWCADGTSAYRFDGTTWQVQPNEPGNAFYATISDTEAYRTTEIGPIEHLQNGVWTSTGVTAPAQDSFVLFRATSATDVIAMSRKGAVFHFDGTGWAKLADRFPASVGDVFPELTVYGGNKRLYNNHTQYDLTLLSFDGACWRSEPVTNKGNLSGSPERLFFTTIDLAINGYYQEVFALTP